MTVVPTWNPWHGCHKISTGCQNCYVYRIDAKYESDSSIVKKTAAFNLPVKRNRAGQYKLQDDDVIYTCFTSDFFLHDADEWRAEIWRMIRERSDLQFLIITKRIDRFHVGLPEDWGVGYDNVCICSTVENQDRADYRLPILLREPIRHKMIICEPLLERVDLSPYLTPEIEKVVAGGESGITARICDYDWILSLRDQCRNAGVAFHFKQTGALFEKDGKVYRIPRKYQHTQARKAGIDLTYD
jgi:protein gp37